MPYYYAREIKSDLLVSDLRNVAGDQAYKILSVTSSERSDETPTLFVIAEIDQTQIEDKAEPSSSTRTETITGTAPYIEAELNRLSQSSYLYVDYSWISSYDSYESAVFSVIVRVIDFTSYSSESYNLPLLEENLYTNIQNPVTHKPVKTLPTGFDIRTIRATGFYAGYSLINTPDAVGSGWCYIIHMEHPEMSNYSMQMVFRYVNVGGDTNARSEGWVSQAQNGSWSSWMPIANGAGMGNLTNNTVSDANLATVSGMYYFNGTSNYPTYLDASQGAGDLIVTSDSSSYTHQIFMKRSGSTTPRIFHRTRQAGTWYSWYEIPLVPSSGLTYLNPRIPKTGHPTALLDRLSVGLMAMNPQTTTNHLLLYPISLFRIYYTTDGASWGELSVSDSIKQALLFGKEHSNVTNFGITYGWMGVRLVFEADSAGYAKYLEYFYAYISFQGHSATFTVEYSSDGTTWSSTSTSDWRVTGWPAHVFLPHTQIPHSSSGTGYYKYARVTITPTWNATYPTYPIVIMSVHWYGSYPYRKREIYDWDYSRNITFPAAISSAGAISAPSASISGAISAQSASISGAVSAASVSATGAISAQSASISNGISALTATINSWTISQSSDGSLVFSR